MRTAATSSPSVVSLLGWPGLGLLVLGIPCAIPGNNLQLQDLGLGKWGVPEDGLFWQRLESLRSLFLLKYF